VLFSVYNKFADTCPGELTGGGGDGEGRHWPRWVWVYATDRYQYGFNSSESMIIVALLIIHTGPKMMLQECY